MAKYLIVGGVAGGMTAAARMRRLSEFDEITVFERGEHVSFANCGLPYYIGGEIQDRDQLFLRTPESFKARYNVDVRIKSEVISIDRKTKKIRVKDLVKNKEYDENYDKLLLCPGAEPVKPALPGIENEKIFRLRSVPDTDRIVGYIKANKPKTAAVIGAGFIGMEMAESLKLLGIDVIVIEALAQVMPVIDPDMAAIAQKELTGKGVAVILNAKVQGFEDAGGKIKIRLSSGAVVADMVLLSIGVAPETKLAQEAGLALGIKKSIAVNEYMQTSDTDIFAVGDAVETTNFVTGKKANIPLAGPANKQARIAADNIISGNKSKYRGTIGASVVKIFDLTIGVTGANEHALNEAGMKYTQVILHPGDHAGYYPGAMPMTLKVLFSPVDGKIYGAQAAGQAGIDKRIDVISALIGKKGTIYDLEEFEQAYAPPYSSAKDPVNMAGFTAENILTGKVDAMTWQELLKSDLKEFFVLDVRTPGEVKKGKLEASVNLPVDSLRQNLATIPKYKKIAVYCGSGVRSGIAARILKQNGFKEVFNISGGFTSYPKG